MARAATRGLTVLKAALWTARAQIGRAACRERRLVTVVAAAFIKKKTDWSAQPEKAQGEGVAPMARAATLGSTVVEAMRWSAGARAKSRAPPTSRFGRSHRPGW